MATISLSAAIILCCVSATVGFVVALLLGQMRQTTVVQSCPTHDDDRSKESAETERQLRWMVESLYLLTSQVDSQVGEHSQRVAEINDSLESGEVGSSTVLAAGKLLLSANQKLQADLEEAKSEIQRQREQADARMVESRTDALTNLANRRAFDLEISRAFSQRRRDGNPFSLLIVDIDHFKKVNDQYGHMVGDQLLKGFARCLTSTFRDCDFVARYGGEEFIVIMPKIPLQDATKAAERLRSAIAQKRFHVGDFELQITASIGAKEVGAHETESQLIERADAALYAAKKNGRNCCYFHDGSECRMYNAKPISENPSTAEAAKPETVAKTVVQPPSSNSSRKNATADRRQSPPNVSA